MRFRRDPTKIRGSIAPVISPFSADGAPDLDSLRALVRWQLDSGSHGISLGGSTGEPSAQSTAERASAIRAAADEIADRVPFVPGTGSAKLDETLELTAIAQAAGADAVLIITPYYARPTQEGLFHWYSTVAAEFPDLPLTEPGQARALALLREGAGVLEGPVAKVARSRQPWSSGAEKRIVQNDE